MIKAAFALCLLVVAATTVANEPFIIMAGGEATSPQQPQACSSIDGVVHVTFGIGDQVFYCTIAGKRCTTPSVAFRIPNMSLGMRRGPRIAQFGTCVTITAIGGAEGKGRDGDVLAYRSTDGGNVLVKREV
jgi:hypothetical protein